MDRHHKVRIAYVGVMAILACIFYLLAQRGENFWVFLEQVEYVYTTAKIITLLAIAYFSFTYLTESKTLRNNLLFASTVLILGVILYFLYQ